MKVFFTGSPRALSTLKDEHERVFNLIEKYNHKNLSSLVINADPQKFYQVDFDARSKHYKETIKNLSESDVMVCEVTYASLSMGFLICRALDFGKPVIALYKDGYDPFFLTGMVSEKLQLVEYNRSNLEDQLKLALNLAKRNLEVRFNLLLDQQLHSYLNFLSQKKSQPKAVIVRDLIKDELTEDEDFALHEEEEARRFELSYW